MRLPRELLHLICYSKASARELIRLFYTFGSTLPLTLTFQPLTLFKWQLYAAQSMRNQWTASASFMTGQEDDDDEQDTLKEAFLGTNPYLLGLTFVVSILHSIFEFLAFKNGKPNTLKSVRMLE